jgi:hypothetical protein
MSKTIPIRLKPREAAQAFVEAGEETRASEFRPKADKGEIVRITLDLPRPLHRKLKMHVAGEEITIAEYMRRLLEERLGAG